MLAAIFEVPVATVLMVWAGLATPQSLIEKRPYIIVACFVIGAVLTPPDVVSQIMLAIQRCHDFNASGWWSIFSIVPLLEVRRVKPSLLLRQDVPAGAGVDWLKWGVTLAVGAALVGVGIGAGIFVLLGVIVADRGLVPFRRLARNVEGAARDRDLSHRVPVPEAPVWAFFRDGDATALRHALGQAPEYSYTAELALHLNHLVARSEALGHESQLASLLPRLQAECSVPMPFEDLKAALTRAQDRWEQQVEEQSTLASLGRELAFQGYPDSFDAARKLGRNFAA